MMIKKSPIGLFLMAENPRSRVSSHCRLQSTSLCKTTPLMLTFTDNTLILASNNLGKIKEFGSLFESAALPVQVIAQGQLGIADAVEDGLSFVENALIKARHAAKASGYAALADDSGLCVPILKGAPGIYSARFGGEHGNDALNNQALLERLRPYRNGQPIPATFVCALVLVRHAEDPLPIICQGVWQGEILQSARGDGGFGYDPLFWLPHLGKSSAELTHLEKHKISHRGSAMAKLRDAIIVQSD
jgi:XTP/dITP diphosphohydrolase